MAAPLSPSAEIVEEQAKPLLGLEVLTWRYECLELAGYPVAAAIALAERGDVDLHVAVGLLAHGCPPEVAVEILT